MSGKNSEIVYHYCDVDAFLSIIQNARLWVSDIFKANDSKECTWIKEVVAEKIKSHMTRKEPEKFNLLRVWEERFTESQPIYVACFSEWPDSLSQWRGYAQDGKGLAIGFSRTYLDDIDEGKDVPIRFQKINYGGKKENDFASEEAARIINCGAAKGLGHAAIALAQPSIEYALYKNPSFVDECEWRIVCQTARNSQKVSLGNKGLWLSKRLYRNSGGQIVSYLEMDFSAVKSEIIKEIRIGPKSKVTEDDVVNLLSDSGYYQNLGEFEGYNSEKPIPIIPSESSYR